MASAMLISVLIVKIFLAFECELSSAHAPVVNLDSNSNTGSLLYQIIDGMYDELKKENKEMEEKIETLEETNDSGLEALRSEVENKNKEIVKTIDKLEEKTDSGLEALQAELETIKGNSHRNFQLKHSCMNVMHFIPGYFILFSSTSMHQNYI